MDLDHPFRNAVFGGFNRQDVLTYLENTSRQTAQQRQELEAMALCLAALVLLAGGVWMVARRRKK